MRRLLLRLWLCSTLGLAVSVAPCAAAVTFDAVCNSGAVFSATTATCVATVSSSANRAAAWGNQFFSNAVSAITSCVNCTALCVGGTVGVLVTGSDTTTTAPATRARISAAAAPPTGSQTFRMCWTTATTADLGVITALGVDQTTPMNNGTFTACAAGGAGCTTTTSSVTVTSTSGDLTTTAATSASSWSTPLTNQTLKYGVSGDSFAGDIGPGTGNTTHTWTDAFNGQEHAISGANFKAFAAGGGCTDSHMMGVWRCDEAAR